MTRGQIPLKQAYVLIHEDSHNPFLIELLPRTFPGEWCIVLFADIEKMSQFTFDRLLPAHAAKMLESPEEIFCFVRDGRFESGEPLYRVGVCLDPIDIPYARHEDYMIWTREDFMEDLVR